jgi:hypothetical protein
VVAQNLGRIVGAERRRPDGPARQEARRAAAAAGLDRAGKVLRLDTLREDDPRHRQRVVELAGATGELRGVAATRERHLALVERGPQRAQLARGGHDRVLARVFRDAHDGLQDREDSQPRGQLDEPARQRDALGAQLVVAPDDEQLQRHDAGHELDVVVQRGVLDDSAGLLHEPVDRKDEAARDMGRRRFHVVAVDQEARGVRGKLRGHGELESPHAFVRRLVAVLAQHGAERLALVHRNHRERAARAGERGQRRRHGSASASSQISASGCS